MAKQKETTKESVEEQSTIHSSDKEERTLNTPTKTQYQVLSFTDAEKLETACGNASRDGWSFVGGVCVSHVTDPTKVTTVYSQAICKHFFE